MECPRCGKSGLSSNGICTNCIFELNQKKAENDGGKAGIPDADRADDPSVKGSQSDASEPTPAWRVELSKRLEALKQEKKLELGKQPPEKPTITQQAPAIQNKAPEKPAVIERPGGDTILSRKQKMESSSPTPSDAPQQKTIASLGEKVFNPPQQNQSKNIRDLIDSAVSRQAGQSIPESSIYVSEAPAEQENKYILLSRTLSGLIDLIIVVLCSTAFIIAADSFSGIINTDGVSVVEFILLFLLIFFIYSIFFLAASGQTIGMMITELKLVGIANTRPSIGQLFTRCFGYLMSVVLGGFGLLWSFFDRKNRCFHDRLSDTSITRI